MKLYKEKKTRKSKPKACLFTAISLAIFFQNHGIRIYQSNIGLSKNEYRGDERIKNKKVLSLVREFEMQRMKEVRLLKNTRINLLILLTR